MRAMSDDMPGEASDLDLAAATLAANAGDVRALLQGLVVQIEGALGDRLEVQRSRGGRLRRGGGSVTGLTCRVGDDLLRAEISGALLRCSIDRISGGIRIRTEQLDVASWLGRLLGAVRAEAAHSEAARVALEQLVIGGQG
jgi:hypothetical protein